uniref:hypothetical protein n=1 Tax=unclassified Flavobacterium TaxID=196869 RepID=UPI001E5FFBA2
MENWNIEKPSSNNFFLKVLAVLTPIKQEYYSKFRLLFMRLIFSLKLDAYPGSISLLVLYVLK